MRKGGMAPTEPKPEAPQSWLASLGPGIVTGAADDDPSGIATYSQAGAQFGYAMTWTMFFTFPLMVGVQLVCARIGRVSGHGLATNIRCHYPAWLLYTLFHCFSWRTPSTLPQISRPWATRSVYSPDAAPTSMQCCSE
jgi:Mn2+/Fe2+ NRAMP family transporter